MTKLEIRLQAAGYNFEKEQEMLYYPKTILVKLYVKLNSNGTVSKVFINRDEIISSHNVPYKELRRLTAHDV